MRKLIGSVFVVLPLLAAAQQDQQPQPPPPEQQNQPPAEPPAAPPSPQYPPQYAPPPQYTPPPPQGQYAPPPQNMPPPPQGQYAPPNQYPPQPYARPLHQRSSWYIGFGIGGGDARVTWPDSSVITGGTYSMKEEFAGTDPTKITVNFKLGATLTPRLLVGADLTEFAAAASYDSSYGKLDQSLGVVVLTGMVTFFPMEKGPFVRGGLGFASFAEKISGSGIQTWTADASGLAFTGGVGYSFWIGRSFNLSANLDYSGQSYSGGNDTPKSTSFWSLGLGFDWY